MTLKSPARTRPAEHSLPTDFPELRLQQHSWAQGYVTVAASMPRLSQQARDLTLALCDAVQTFPRVL